MFKYKQKGFTLIGVITTLFIVTIGLVGVISLANMSLKSATTSKMRLIAAGLAQEGIEVIRDIRRANSDATGWSNWYNAIVNDNYLVQYDKDYLISFSDTTLLKIDAQGFYQYDSGNDSPFYRRINFNKISSNELQLTVEIKWYLRGQWSYLTVEDRLWDWK